MTESKKTSADVTPERIQKIIAQAGIASRRDAEDLISEGLVTVNGKTAKLGEKAQFGIDAIKVKGKLIIAPEHKVYYLFYKPKNVIAMVNEDEEGRPTIKDFTKHINERVFTVGRMDFTGEGAILLTNDGDLAQKLTKSNDLFRRYQVKVDRHPTQDDLARLARGGRIEKVTMNPHHVRVVSEYAKNALIEVSFQGSGATEVRKFFENKGFHPEKIVRVGIGHIKADKMTPGEFKKLEASSVQALLTQPELAEKLIANIVKGKSDNFKVIDGKSEVEVPTAAPKAKVVDAEGNKLFGRAKRDATPKRKGFNEVAGVDETRVSRRPPRGRPRPEGRTGARPAFSDRKPFGDRAPRSDRPSFGGDRPFSRAPRAEGSRPSFGGERKSFGDRKPFGDRAPRGDRPSFGGDRPSFGDRAPRGRPAFGDRKPFGDRAPRGDRPSFSGDRPSFGDRAPRGRPAFGDRKPFGDRAPRGDRPSFGDRKPFGDRAPRGDRPSFGGARGGRPMGRPSFGGGGSDRAAAPRFRR